MKLILSLAFCGLLVAMMGRIPNSDAAVSFIVDEPTDPDSPGNNGGTTPPTSPGKYVWTCNASGCKWVWEDESGNGPNNNGNLPPGDFAWKCDINDNCSWVKTDGTADPTPGQFVWTPNSNGVGGTWAWDPTIGTEPGAGSGSCPNNGFYPPGPSFGAGSGPRMCSCF